MEEFIPKCQSSIIRHDKGNNQPIVYNEHELAIKKLSIIDKYFVNFSSNLKGIKGFRQ